ncbi:MAG: hypothetical protein MJE66_07950 [Proteobacteria bacterium]|nr:hypothetical protein [Pseudomonadota bacterium]
MIVSEIRDECQRDGTRELSASLRFESGGDSHPLWLRRPAPGPPPPGYADPLFATLFISAMALGEPLRIEGPVSGPLIDRVRKHLVPVLLRWHPRLQEVEIECEIASAIAAAPDAGTAGFFSGGVDSWYTLTDAAHELHELIHIHGFEIAASERGDWERAHAGVRRVGKSYGLGVTAVATNFMLIALDEVTRRLAAQGRPWERLGTDAWYGSLLVAVALALRPRFGRVVIPASWSARTLYPVASHPLMEPAWSTPAQRYEIHGFAVTRIQKLRALVESDPAALEALRVCVAEPGRAGDRLNCGRCLKCVRLMFELRVCGVRDFDHLFHRGLKLEWAMRKRFPGDASIWRALRDEAEASGDEEVARAVRVMLDEEFHFPRLRADLRRAVAKRSLRELHWPRRPSAG